MGQPLERMRSIATIRGFSRVDELPPIKLDKLEVYAVDGFRKWHWLSVSDLKEVKFFEVKQSEYIEKPKAAKD
jgi:hypothetical protein